MHKIINIKMLRLSSIPNEYYCGDLPGTLQYNKNIEELISLNTEGIDEETRGFQICEHSLENLRRITPRTQKNIKWKIILMMKSDNANLENRFDGEIWIKAALLNQETGKIALLTTTNSRVNLERRGARPVRTLDDEWFVGHYRLCAPIVFWRELKNRLLY
jgi:hypothetical protein